MAETIGGQGLYKARKTPAVVHPTIPPKLPTGIEVLFHSIDPEVLEKTIAGFRDRIVTSQILYRPAILAAARINFHGNRWQIHFEKDILRVVSFPSKHQFCQWDDNLNADWNHHDLRTLPDTDSVFVYDSTYDFSAERFAELEEDFRQHLLSTIVLTVEYNPHFKIDRKPDESSESFMARCMEQARAEFNQESHNVEETLHRLQDRLKQRLEREEREINTERQKETERHDTNAMIGEIKKEIEGLQNLRKAKMDELEENLMMIAKERERDVLRISRSNLLLLRFALIWVPYTEFVIQEDNARRLELVKSF